MSTPLIERLEARSKRRSRTGVGGRADQRIRRLTGLSSVFFARFGLEDELWAQQPDEPGSTDWPQYLSGKRYYARMRRLALSRWWRERRRHEFQARRPGLRTAARKRFPGEPRRGFSWGTALESSAMVLPPGPVDHSPGATEESAPVPRRSGWVATSVADSPWLVTPWTPARVARKSTKEEARVIFIERDAEAGPARRPREVHARASRRASADRPAERVGRRLQQVASQRDPVVRAAQAAAPLLDTQGRKQLARVLARTVTLDEHTRVVEIRKVLRKVAGARTIRTVVEELDPQARPAQVARARGGRRGLRPVLRSSAAFVPSTEALADPARSVDVAGDRGVPTRSSRLSAPITRRSRAASPVVRATRGARIVRTASGVWTPVRPEPDGLQAPVSRPPGDWTGASTTRTAQRDWVGAAVAHSAATSWAAARAVRTPSLDWAGAASTTTARTPFRHSAVHRTSRGVFVGARSGTSARGEWAPARLGAANWAAERIETTGRPGRTHGGRRSLLPRMAPPTAPEGTLVVHADSVDEAEAIAERVRHMGATARIAESPWRSTPWTGARVAEKPSRAAPAVAAAERATKLPKLAATISRVITRKAAADRGAVRGPLAHARTSPASTATVIRHVVGNEWEGARSGKTPRGAWAGAGSFTTSAGDWTGAGTFRTPSSDWAGAGTFTTSSGDWTGARKGTPRVSGWTGAPVGSTPSSAWTGARSGSTPRTDWTGAGSAVTERRPWSGARSGRTFSSAWDGASSFVTPDGSWEGAHAGATRPTDWLGARVAFGQGSSAYRGAFSTTTARSSWSGAGVFGTPRRAWAAAHSTRTPLGWHHAPDMAVPRREMTETLAAMAHGSPTAGIPGWAERTDRPHRIRASGELLRQLADARDPRAVVEIIVSRGAELRDTRLPKPVIQIIEQIQAASAGGGDARQSLQDRAREARTSLGGAPQRGGFRRGTRSTTRVINGWTGLRPGASAATSQSAVGADKVMRLAQKLKSLIHLAQGGQVAEAQRHAKLAHADRPDKSIEKGGDVGESETAFKQSVDIEALGREVLEVVNRELEVRQERRQEDNDVNNWW